MHGRNNPTLARGGDARHTGTPPGGGATTPVGILVIDDDPDCRLLIHDAIAESGLGNPVHEANNAYQAWQLLAGEPAAALTPRPGLIFLDVEMPGMDGIQLLRQIKSHPTLREIVVVMMTGVADEQQMHAAMAAGANSYTLKAAQANQFLQTVVECTRYWLTVHQRPEHHLPAAACRR